MRNMPSVNRNVNSYLDIEMHIQPEMTIITRGMF